MSLIIKSLRDLGLTVNVATHRKTFTEVERPGVQGVPIPPL